MSDPWAWMDEIQFVDDDGNLVDINGLDVSGESEDPDDELTVTREELIALLGYDPREEE